MNKETSTEDKFAYALAGVFFGIIIGHFLTLIAIFHIPLGS